MALILVVDDDPWILKMVRNTLARRGHAVRTAQDGALALAAVAEFSPDLIISDVRMPRMDGHALVRALRARPQTALTPVLFLTSADGEEERMKGFGLGADGYMTKPFAIDDLAARAERMLRRKPRTEEVRARQALGAPAEPEPERLVFGSDEVDEDAPTLVVPFARVSRRPPAARVAGGPLPGVTPAPAAPPAAPSAPARPAALDGSLQELGIAAVLTILDMEKKAGTLEVTGPGGARARVWLRDGRPVAARIEGERLAEGEDVVYALLRWSAGTFRFEPGDEAVPETIHNSTMNLLLEGARRMDEEGR